MKRRFYEIKGNFMYYYVKEGDDKPNGIMYLPNKLLSQEKSKGKFMIKIYSYDAQEEYKRIFASSEIECDIWFNAMQKASKNEDITKIYKMKETLGVGKFSTVRKAYLIQDETQCVAVKVIAKKNLNEKELDYMTNEMAALNVINHPNIPKVISKFETPDKLYIVMENIKDGELFGYLIDSDKLPFEEATYVIHKLLTIVKYLDELKIMHRDIKTENMLIKKKRGLISKIYLIDFGLAKFVDSREIVDQKLGTLGYCAPEVITKTPYNQSVDMWSIGIIYFLLLTGTLPFDGKTSSSITEKTCKDAMPLNDKVIASLDSKVSKFLDRACQKNPADRLSLKQAL